MLTKPKAGWSDFQLTGTSVYGLSYIIGDLPFDWIEQAIHGLETWNPFCVTANLEPGCFICVVGYHNCHIIVEEDEWSHSSQEEEISTELSHTTMMDFCKDLYDDIVSDFNEWVNFGANEGTDLKKRAENLQKQLEQLKETILIAENKHREVW